MELKDQLKLSPNVSVMCIHNETVLYDIISENYYSLNSVGSILIQGIENNLTIEELGSEIISKYNNVTFHQAIEDINHLVANLRERNLIVK